MFRFVLVMLTCAGVLWHALVGCCAHHGHESTRPAISASCEGCSHADRESSATGVPARPHSAGVALESICCDHGGSDRDCSEERCAFPDPRSSGEPQLETTGDYSLIAFAAFSVGVERASSLSVVCSHDPPPSPGGAMRRHLALGVLRI